MVLVLVMTALDKLTALVLPTRSEAPASLRGLWPELALLPHSCWPNASHYVVDGHMVVR